jgi:S-adenosylmethionine synthetase
MTGTFVFASESVTAGHPDKLCDQISDAILDRFLQQDPFARVVAECAVSKGVLFIAARFAASAAVDIAGTARQVIAQAGYDQGEFNAYECGITTSFLELADTPDRLIDERTLDDEAIERITAKNMANAFGYACTQTAAMLPLPIWLAHKLARRLAAVRLQRRLAYLAPDGKCQIGVEYADRRASRIHTITLVTSQLEPGFPNLATLRKDLLEFVIEPAFQDEEIKPDDRTRVFINPEGIFAVGGPAAHSGLTGRKTAVDSYGEYSRNSETALSGKDPARIDRVGVYAARHAAKSVVAAGLAEECEVHLNYAAGQARPLSIRVATHGTGRMPDEQLCALIARHFDFRPAGIIRRFNLRFLPALSRGGFYRRLAAYGHVGRMDIGLPWEATDITDLLRSDVKT